jgi:hypothetical protein
MSGISADLPGTPSSAFPAALVGAWDMIIDWESPRRFLWNQTGRVRAEAIISRDDRGLAMDVHSPGSDSMTRVAEWSDREPGKPALCYIYDVNPRAGALLAGGAYSGAAILRYDSRHNELRGNYWTSARTTGEFTLVRPGKDPARAPVTKLSFKRRGRFMFKAFGATVILLLLGAMLWFLLGPFGRPAQTQAQQDLEFAVKQASATCLMNTSEQERRRIETGVSSRLDRYAAKGEVTTERAHRAVNETFSEPGQILQGRELQECMLKNTDHFLEKIAPPKVLSGKR